MFAWLSMPLMPTLVAIRTRPKPRTSLEIA